MADEQKEDGGGKRRKTDDAGSSDVPRSFASGNVVSITVRIPGAPALTECFRVERTTKLSEAFDAHAVRIGVTANPCASTLTANTSMATSAPSSWG
jgi:hypothetical protein